jgi:hypothetical protein
VAAGTAPGCASLAAAARCAATSSDVLRYSCSTDAMPAVHASFSAHVTQKGAAAKGGAGLLNRARRVRVSRAVQESAASQVWWPPDPAVWHGNSVEDTRIQCSQRAAPAQFERATSRLIAHPLLRRAGVWQPNETARTCGAGEASLRVICKQYGSFGGHVGHQRSELTCSISCTGGALHLLLVGDAWHLTRLVTDAAARMREGVRVDCT